MTDSNGRNPPSPFISHWVTQLATWFLAKPRALDVACGRGRHLLAAAAAGFEATGIDVQLDALVDAHAAASRAHLHISLICADLTTYPLPRERFEVVIVTRYLDRALFPALRSALVPGGVLLYETFTERQLAYGRGPRSAAHLLRPGELRTWVRGMDVLLDEEVSAPDALARVAARKKNLASR